MKKSLFAVAGAAALSLSVFLTGCTTVESTQKFNRMGLGTPNEKAVCQTYVEISGLFFLGLPIFVGSPHGDGEWTMCRYNLTAENVTYLLTREAKSRKAARVVNVNINRTKNIMMMGLMTYETIQASGTGVRTRGAAIDNAAREFDSQP